MRRVRSLIPKVPLAQILATATKSYKERLSGRESLFSNLKPNLKKEFPGYNIYKTSQLDPVPGLAASNALYLLAARNRHKIYNNGEPVITVDAGKMGISNVQVVCTPTADTPGSGIVAHFGDGERYFFGNPSEGTQRIMNQRKVPASRICSIFVTGNTSWKNIGGILGLILTVADMRAEYLKAMEQHNAERQKKGKPPAAVRNDPLNIWGGKNLIHALATARGFIFRKGLPLNPQDIVETSKTPTRTDAKPDWQDDNIRVWHVPLVPEGWDPIKDAQDPLSKDVVNAVVRKMFGSEWRLDKLFETMLYDVKLPAKIFVRDSKGRLQQYQGPLPGGTEKCENIPVLVRKPWPASNDMPLPKTEPDSTSLCYIVKGHVQRGKFLAGKAIALGIHKESFKHLVAGKEVFGKDHVLVTPDMVMDPNIPGTGFAVIDIRHPNLIESFLQRPEWSNQEIMQGIEVFYWIVSDEVKNDQRLVDWIKARPSGGQPKHFMLGHGLSPNSIALESPAKLTLKMNAIDPDRFPLPVYCNETALPESLAAFAQIAKPGETVKLKPQLALDKASAVPFMDTAAPVNEIRADKEIVALVEAARQKLADPNFIAEVEAAEKGMPTHGVEVVALGTGSALPSKYRNVSANLIRVPGCGNYLLDCGENTLGQLRRLYGFEGADEIIKDLHAIYISHSHADHHLGTASVLARRAVLAKEDPNMHPVAFIATQSMMQWLKDYQQVEDLGFPDHVALLEVKFEAGEVRGIRPTPATRGAVSLPNIEACGVDHCFDAMGVAFTWPSGLKIAYSGDCRPSQNFARIGRGAHLLIHESTFDSELVGEAKAKKHSTMAEALEVGRQMRARRILLTHFSQRYPKFPNVEETTGQTVLFAFDLMSVNLHEFKQAELFIPALRLLFKDEHYGDVADEAPVEDVCVPAEGREEVSKQQKAPAPKQKKKTLHEDYEHFGATGEDPGEDRTTHTRQGVEADGKLG
ncbi:hypothetical protein QBC34DRAFT_407122 [Podospora aff. communis PSN243]|uniref:ribonuclease Z n=1 Tax=Podospora aff. communis PSN243 TaxID=3040156 RepID=A0AAV9GKJ7_9PEZI|nr:hypothetical protein QBC34DRAFT_407122 [Podospora aff. communis PSN243]